MIVVDDGSTDGSVRVLRSYGDRICWETGPNRGGCAARNRALQLSRGEYIQFLDADDLLDPAKVERQLPMLTTGNADMVLCQIGLFGDQLGRRMETRPHPVPEGDPFFYFVKYPIGTAAPLHRRSLLETVGGFRDGLPSGQEYELHLRLGVAGVRLAMVNDVLLWVRMHDGPRVTNRPFSPTHGMHLLSGVARFALEAPSSPEIRRLLASRLLGASRKAIEAGARDDARRCIQLVEMLDPQVYRSRLMYAASALVGMRGAETLRAGVKRAIRACSSRTPWAWRSPRVSKKGLITLRGEADIAKDSRG